jgi:flagellar basal body-associated protein FliL
MKVNKKAESIIWIIIWIFILSFVITWIWIVIWNSKDLIRNFDMKMDLDLLTTSSYSIMNNMDTSSLSDW